MGSRAKSLAPRLALLVTVAVTGLLCTSFLPTRTWLWAAVGWVQNAGVWGIAAYVGLYFLVALFMLPGAPLTAGAGYLFGPVLGTLMAMGAGVAAATLTFSLSRYLSAGVLSRALQARPAARVVQKLMDEAAAQRGLRTVFLLRVSPLFPFNLLNYLLGLTDVRLWHFVVGTVLGMWPGSLLWAYLGSTVSQLGALAQNTGGPAQPEVLWGGLAMSALVMGIMARWSRQTLRRMVPVNRQPP